MAIRIVTQIVSRLYGIERKFLEWEEKKENHILAVTLAGVILGGLFTQSVSNVSAVIGQIYTISSACLLGLNLECTPEKLNIHLFTLPTIIVFLIGVLLYGHGRWDEWFHKRLLQHPDKNPRIGILELPGDPKLTPRAEGGNASWTLTPISEWERLISRKAEELDFDFEIERITIDQVLHSYTAVLNPYGGVYPESDLENQRSLSKIANYVSEGGVFINAADFPCFWAYSQEHDHAISISKKEYMPFPVVDDDMKIIGFRPEEVRELFSNNPLIKQLNIEIIGIDDEQVDIRGHEYEVKRIMGDEANVNGFASIGDDENNHVFANVQYGKGDFIFSMFSLMESAHETGDIDLLHDYIVEKSLTSLRERGLNPSI